MGGSHSQGQSSVAELVLEERRISACLLSVTTSRTIVPVMRHFAQLSGVFICFFGIENYSACFCLTVTARLSVMYHAGIHR